MLTLEENGAFRGQHIKLYSFHPPWTHPRSWAWFHSSASTPVFSQYVWQNPVARALHVALLTRTRSPPPKKKLFPQPPNPKLNVPQQPTSGKNPSVLATCPQTTHLKIQKLPWPCLKSETALTTGISFPRQHQHVFPVAHLCSPLPSSLPQPEPGDTFCLHLTRLSHHTYTPPGQRALRQRLLRQQLAIPLSAFLARNR